MIANLCRLVVTSACLVLASCNSLADRNQSIEKCVQVSEIVKNPDLYDGRQGFYCGVFRDEYPLMTVYVDMDAARSGNFEQRISSRYSDCIVGSGGEGLGKFNGVQARVRGIFNRHDVETSGLSAGSFSDVTEIMLGVQKLRCNEYELRVIPGRD